MRRVANFEKLLIIGCGNMGGAMLAGWLAAGLSPSRFAVLDPALEQTPDGVALFHDPADASDHDAVLLGFKPQQLSALGPQLQSVIEGRVVFSLLAGIELASLAKVFPSGAAHIRVMPNLAARLNKSPVILAEAGLSAEMRKDAQTLFGLLGTAVWLPDEDQFNLVTALAGSGPGFVYRFIDALAKAGIELGLASEMAESLALATVEGASALAASSECSPAGLADRVASPGGMTREGLNVLDEHKALISLLKRTLELTAKKGDELAKGAEN